MQWTGNLLTLAWAVLWAALLPAQSPDLSGDRIDRLNDHAWELARSLPDSAEKVANQAIQLSREAGNYPKGLMNAHTLLGILNKDRGFYGISVEHYLTVLELAEKEEDYLRVSSALNNLGSVYAQKGNDRQALNYFRQSLDLEEKYGEDQGQLSIRLFNIGESYLKLDSLDEAAAYFYNSLLIEEKLQNEEGIFYARLGIGKVDLQTGNLPKAEQELGKASSLALKLNNHPGICESGLALGDLAVERNDFARARAEYKKVIERARQFGYKKLQSEALWGLNQMARSRKDYGEALRYQDEFYALKEQLNNDKVNNQIGELQARYELKKKEQEIELLRQSELLRENEIKYERKLRNYLLLMVGLVLLLTGYNIFRGRKEEEGND